MLKSDLEWKKGGKSDCIICPKLLKMYELPEEEYLAIEDKLPFGHFYISLLDMDYESFIKDFRLITNMVSAKHIMKLFDLSESDLK